VGVPAAENDDGAVVDAVAVAAAAAGVVVAAVTFIVEDISSGRNWMCRAGLGGSRLRGNGGGLEKARSWIKARHVRTTQAVIRWASASGTRSNKTYEAIMSRKGGGSCS